MSPAGRPPLSDARKHERLMIRLTDVEKASLDVAAAFAGKPTSTWARDLLLAAAKIAELQKKPATKKAPAKTPKKKPA